MSLEKNSHKSKHQRTTRSKKTKKMTVQERIKWEVAEELGLLDQIENSGWESLSCIECGRIGGMVRQRLKHL